MIRERDQVQRLVPRGLRQVVGGELGVRMQGMAVELRTDSAHIDDTSSTVRRYVHGRVMTAWALTPTRHVPASRGPSVKP